MNLGLAIKLVMATAYVSFAAAALGSGAYLLFERSSRDEEVDALVAKLATTRARLDLLYLAVGLCTSLAAIGLGVVSFSAPGTPVGGGLLAAVLLALYYGPVTVATAFCTVRGTRTAIRAVARFSAAGLVLVLLALAIQYLT